MKSITYSTAIQRCVLCESSVSRSLQFILINNYEESPLSDHRIKSVFQYSHPKKLHQFASVYEMRLDSLPAKLLYEWVSVSRFDCASLLASRPCDRDHRTEAGQYPQQVVVYSHMIWRRRGEVLVVVVTHHWYDLFVGCFLRRALSGFVVVFHNPLAGVPTHRNRWQGRI